MNKCILYTMLVLALVLPATAMGMASFDFPVVNPVLSIVVGNVTVKGAAQPAWRDGVEGMLLASGDSVKTGVGARAEISCATGKMRIYENTVLVIPAVADEGDKKDIRSVNLEDGAGLFRIRKRGVQKGFEVRTDHIIAGVKGTLFAVLTSRAKKFSKVAVYSGVVEVTDIKRSPGSRTKLGKGDFMEVMDDKGFGDTDDFDPDNAWKDWEKLTLPDIKPPSKRTEIIVTHDGDDSERVRCDPVTDDGGEPIYYEPPSDEPYMPR